MNPLRDTPPNVIDKLLTWGGKNLHGETNWRLLPAGNHLVLRAGVWTEFEPDREKTRYEHMRSEAGSYVKYEHREIAADAVKVGTFWVPLYPVSGWILERWFPPSAFGTKEAWYSALSQDNQTPMMGPYPDRGDYWLMAGPWDEIPPLEPIRIIISQWENNPDNLRGVVNEEKLADAVRLAVEAEEQKEQAKHDQMMEVLDYQVEHHLGFIKANPQLSALRNKIASKNGFHSHI